jgi:hypothetical protein
MRKLFAIFFTFILFQIITSQAPDWVEQFEAGKNIENYNDYYWGIGTSHKTSEKADNGALQQFSRNIETIVKSKIKNQIAEAEGKVSEFTMSSTEISSDVGLRGICITERYQDNGKFYSIIKYKKTEYNQILAEEIQRDIERKKMQFEKAQQETKLQEAKAKEDLRRKQEKQRIKRKRSEMKQQYITRFKEQYSDFFQLQAPCKILNTSGASLCQKPTQVLVKGRISPISISKATVSKKIWFLQLTANSLFDSESRFQQAEFYLKYRMLKCQGRFIQAGFSVGASAYFTNLQQEDFLEAEQSYSPFLAATVILPHMRFSYANLYADFNKMSVASQSYLFYPQMKHYLAVILELNYIWNEDLRNSHDDLLVFQPALKFQTTSYLSTMLSYEQNEYMMLSLEVNY